MSFTLEFFKKLVKFYFEENNSKCNNFCSIWSKKSAKHKLAYHFTKGFLAIPKVEHGTPWFERAIT
jgi:hypothetical protein